MTGFRPQLIELPRLVSELGSLTILDSGDGGLPFVPRRAFFVNDIPWGTRRWTSAHEGQAYREQTYLYTVCSGMCRVLVHDGKEETEFALDSPSHGLLLPPLFWRRFLGFVSSTVLLAVASGPFQDDDYIRDFDEFLEMRS